MLYQITVLYFPVECTKFKGTVQPQCFSSFAPVESMGKILLILVKNSPSSSSFSFLKTDLLGYDTLGRLATRGMILWGDCIALSGYHSSGAILKNSNNSGKT